MLLKSSSKSASGERGLFLDWMARVAMIATRNNWPGKIPLDI